MEAGKGFLFTTLHRSKSREGAHNEIPDIGSHQTALLLLSLFSSFFMFLKVKRILPDCLYTRLTRCALSKYCQFLPENVKYEG